jgi:hypothetical protein
VVECLRVFDHVGFFASATLAPRSNAMNSTLRWFHRLPKSIRCKGIGSRCRPWLERLEDRCLLAALPPADLVSWSRAENNAYDFADGNHGTLQGGMEYAPGHVQKAFSFRRRR